MIRQVLNGNTINHNEKMISEENKEKVFVQREKYVYACALLTIYIQRCIHDRMPRNILHLLQLSYSVHNWNGNRSLFAYELNF